MLLKEIYTTEVVYCSREASLLEVARTMREEHVGDLIVVDDADDERIPVGVITDRDIIVKALGKELDPRTTRVADIMRCPIVTAQESEDSSEALARMRAQGVRRLPVVGAHGRLVGIVTLDDLLKLVAADANALLEIVRKERDHEQRTCR